MSETMFFAEVPSVELVVVPIDVATADTHQVGCCCECCQGGREREVTVCDCPICGGERVLSVSNGSCFCFGCGAKGYVA